MRNGFVALMMLLSTAGTASAQQVGVVAQKIVASTQQQAANLTPDDVIARLLFFDRNHDGKVATGELSERMQRLVARGDANRDGALDAAEIYGLAVSPQELITLLRNRPDVGSYGFGDSVGQVSSRMHLENSIDDLRLPVALSAQAKRIGQAFVDEMEAAARVHLRQAMAPLLMPDAFAEFDRDLARPTSTLVFFLSDTQRSPVQTFVVVGSDPVVLSRRYQFGPEQLQAATAVMETFKAEQQFDEVRRAALVARLSDILNEEECDNVRAALARRPIVKGAGVGGAAELELLFAGMVKVRSTAPSAP